MDVDTEVIKGRIDRITYKNAENGYTVFSLTVDGEDVVAVGNFPFITLGDTVTLKGRFTVHATYGPQFKATECTREIPSTSAAIMRYLSSGAVKGIGPATARKIVTRFGNETLEILKDYPERLCEIRGISPDKARAIASEYKKQFSIQDIMLFMVK